MTTCWMIDVGPTMRTNFTVSSTLSAKAAAATATMTRAGSQTRQTAWSDLVELMMSIAKTKNATPKPAAQPSVKPRSTG